MHVLVHNVFKQNVQVGKVLQNVIFRHVGIVQVWFFAVRTVAVGNRTMHNFLREVDLGAVQTASVCALQH